ASGTCTPRGVVTRSVSPRRGASPHAPRGAGLVPREPGRVLARVSLDALRRRAAARGRALRPGRRRLGIRERRLAAFLGEIAGPRRRALCRGRAGASVLGSRHAPRTLLGRPPLTLVLRGGRAPPDAGARVGRESGVRAPGLPPPSGRGRAAGLRRVRRFASLSRRAAESRSRPR